MLMKKFLSLIVVLVACLSANATPYKALYAEAAAAPSAGGVVYLSPKSEEDAGFVAAQSEDWDETVFIKWVGGENSDGANYPGCTGGIGLYEVLVLAEPNPGYEVVCIANTIKEDGVYTEADCYAAIHGNSAQDFSFDFDYSTIEKEGVKINVNNVDHPQDGHSDSGPKREEVFENFNTYVSATPDTYVYVIFRKVGDEFPMFVSGETSIRETTVDSEKEGVTYNIAGQQVGKIYKGVVIKNGKKVIIEK